MLKPTSVNLSLMSLARTMLRQGGREVAKTEPFTTTAAEQGRLAGDSLDLSDDLDARLEQDVDYQILRKSFALDRTAAHRTRQQDIGHVRADKSDAKVSIDDGDLFDLLIQRSSGAGRSAAAGRSVRAETAGHDQVSVSRTGADLSVAIGRRESGSASLDVALGGSAPIRTGDPLALDLSGAGIATTGVEQGIQFDLTGDGQREQVSFATGDTWFLALDQNGNGTIDDGHELFGDQNGADNGFTELAGYDENADGVIDNKDAVFSQLKLVQVAADGTQALESLLDSGVTAIELGYQNCRKALDLYDRVAQSGQFQRADGSTGEAADVLVGYRRKV